MFFEINGIRWCISEVESNSSLLISEDGKRCKGTTHYLTHFIYLDKDLPLTDKSSTLMHELTHAALYSTQIELKENYTEENLCEFVAMYGSMIYNIAYKYINESFNIKIDPVNTKSQEATQNEVLQNFANFCSGVFGLNNQKREIPKPSFPTFNACCCGGQEEKYKRDCYFYHEDFDMGATIPYCTYDNKGFGHCSCKDCDHFLDKAEANKIVRADIEEKESKNNGS